jgi:hypothetical protein
MASAPDVAEASGGAGLRCSGTPGSPSDLRGESRYQIPIGGFVNGQQSEIHRGTKSSKSYPRAVPAAKSVTHQHTSASMPWGVSSSGGSM